MVRQARPVVKRDLTSITKNTTNRSEETIKLAQEPKASIENVDEDRKAERWDTAVWQNIVDVRGIISMGDMEDKDEKHFGRHRLTTVVKALKCYRCQCTFKATIIECFFIPTKCC